MASKILNLYSSPIVLPAGETAHWPVHLDAGKKQIIMVQFPVSILKCINIMATWNNIDLRGALVNGLFPLQLPESSGLFEVYVTNIGRTLEQQYPIEFRCRMQIYNGDDLTLKSRVGLFTDTEGKRHTIILDKDGKPIPIL